MFLNYSVVSGTRVFDVQEIDLLSLQYRVSFKVIDTLLLATRQE